MYELSVAYIGCSILCNHQEAVIKVHVTYRNLFIIIATGAAPLFYVDQVFSILMINMRMISQVFHTILQSSHIYSLLVKILN